MSAFLRSNTKKVSDRNPDFRSTEVEFWFEPEMMAKIKCTRLDLEKLRLYILYVLLNP